MINNIVMIIIINKKKVIVMERDMTRYIVEIPLR